MEYKSKKLIKLLRKNGWKLVSITGSHYTFKNLNYKKLITVPMHNKSLGIGLAKKILKEANINYEENNNE